MAGVKKKGLDYYLKFLPLSLFGLFIITTIILIATGSLNGPSYEDYKEYKIKLEDSLNQGGSYLIYFYSENCSNCDKIKKEVFSFIEKGYYSLYLIDGDDPDNKFKTITAQETGGYYDNSINVGETDPFNIKLYGYPTIMIVIDGEIQLVGIGISGTENSPGVLDILEELSLY